MISSAAAFGLSAGYFVVVLLQCAGVSLSTSQQLQEDRMWGSQQPERWELASGRTARFQLRYTMLFLSMALGSVGRVVQFAFVGTLQHPSQDVREVFEPVIVWQFSLALSFCTWASFSLLYYFVEQQNFIGQLDVNCECCPQRWLPSVFNSVFGDRWVGVQPWAFRVCLGYGVVVLAVTECRVFEMQQPELFEPYRFSYFVVLLLGLPLLALRFIVMYENLTAEGGWHANQLRQATVSLQVMVMLMASGFLLRCIRPCFWSYWNLLPSILPTTPPQTLVNQTLTQTGHMELLWGTATLGDFALLWDDVVTVLEYWICEVAMLSFVTATFMFYVVAEAQYLKLALVTNAERDLSLSLRHESRVKIPLIVMWFPWFQHLKVLDMAHNNLEALSPHIARLEFLERVDLEDNLLTELPYEFGYLERLRVLSLRHNKLSQLPDTFRYLVKIAFLDCSSNQLSEIPDTILWMPELKKLNLRFNRLEHLRDDLHSLLNLERLLLAHNVIQEIPANLFLCPAVWELDLSHNEIKACPISLLRDSKVSVLHLEENPVDITEVQGFRDFWERNADFRKERLRKTVAGVMSPEEYKKATPHEIQLRKEHPEFEQMTLP